MKLAVHQRLASMKPSWQCGWVSILQLELCQMKPSFPWRGSSCVLFRWQVYLCSIQWRALLSTRARRCSVGPEPKILQCGLLLRKALSPGSAESSQLCPDSASQELSHRKTWIYLEFRKSTDFKRRGGGGGLNRTSAKQRQQSNENIQRMFAGSEQKRLPRSPEESQTKNAPTSSWNSQSEGGGVHRGWLWGC